MYMLKVSNVHPFSALLFSLSRIEYDDRQEALLRALQQNVGRQVQIVGRFNP